MTYFERLVEEKGISGYMLKVEGNSGINLIPVEVLIDYIMASPICEQKAIKNMLVKIDFLNGNIVNYLKHLAKAIAL